MGGLHTTAEVTPPEISAPLWRLGRKLVHLVVRISHRIEVVRPPVLPATGVIVACKHSAWTDIPILATALYTCAGRRPYFEMGSFYGYKLLGLLRPLLMKLGGFPVMRPKEVLRMKRKEKLGREELVARMEAMNAKASGIRRALFRKGELFVYFPEGTRTRGVVTALKSTAELEDAVAAAAQGTRIVLVPAMINYAWDERVVPFRRRREVRIGFGDAVDLAGLSLAAATAVIKRHFEETIVPWFPEGAPQKKEGGL